MTRVTKIDDIEMFIRFFIDLFNEEFNYAIDYTGALYYFTHGGCFEFAQIINHYFDNTQYVVKNDGTHVAILYNDKIYDVTNGYEVEELIKRGYDERFYEKNLSNYHIVSEEELNTYNFGTLKNVIINDQDVVNGVITELDSIDTIKIGF